MEVLGGREGVRIHASYSRFRSIDYGLTFNDDNGKFDQKALIDDFYVSPANGAKVRGTGWYTSVLS